MCARAACGRRRSQAGVGLRLGRDAHLRAHLCAAVHAWSALLALRPTAPRPVDQASLWNLAHVCHEQVWRVAAVEDMNENTVERGSVSLGGSVGGEWSCRNPSGVSVSV